MKALKRDTAGYQPPKEDNYNILNKDLDEQSNSIDENLSMPRPQNGMGMS